MIELRGAWEAGNLKPVRDTFTLAEQGCGNVVLNMASVRSIDSAFVGLLLLLEQSLATRHLSLRLTATPWIIKRYLQLSSVSHLVVE